jgi:hypothetical protein
VGVPRHGSFAKLSTTCHQLLTGREFYYVTIAWWPWKRFPPSLFFPILLTVASRGWPYSVIPPR